MVVRDNTDCRNAFDVKELRHPSSIKVLSMFSSENQWISFIALFPEVPVRVNLGRQTPIFLSEKAYPACQLNSSRFHVILNRIVYGVFSAVWAAS